MGSEMCIRDSDGGQATAAQLNVPRAIAFDANGNLFVADANNNRVRKIDRSTGIITTVVGNGTGGNSGDGGQATSAAINFPAGIVFNSSGEMFITDSNNGAIRRINTSGVIETIATGFNLPQQLAIDASNNLYVADFLNWQIKKLDASNSFASSVIAGTGTSGYSGDGGLATAAQISLGQGCKLIFDKSNNIYFADVGNHAIRRIDAGTGIMTTIAGTGMSGYSGDDGLATQATFFLPSAIAFNASGEILITDSNNNVIRLIGCPPECELTINTQPTNALICDGDDVSFTVEASSGATGDLTYQWQKVTPSTSTNWVNIGRVGTPGFPNQNQVSDFYLSLIHI